MALPMCTISLISLLLHEIDLLAHEASLILDEAGNTTTIWGTGGIKDIPCSASHRGTVGPRSESNHNVYHKVVHRFKIFAIS